MDSDARFLSSVGDFSQKDAGSLEETGARGRRSKPDYRARRAIGQFGILRHLDVSFSWLAWREHAFGMTGWPI